MKYHIGSEVFWNDPDREETSSKTPSYNGKCSGYYYIVMSFLND